MTRLISARLAGNILLVALGLFIVFHVLVLLGVAPADVIWGGRASDSRANLVALEIIALVVTTLFAIIVAAKVGYVDLGALRSLTNMGTWIIFAFLLLNTIGNLASTSSTETLIFTPITLILAFCALRLALENKPGAARWHHIDA